jgi:uncharacterized protein YecE (DUF72 family)
MKKEGNCMEKNLQEFYEELVKSDSLINEYKEAQKNGTVVEVDGTYYNVVEESK